MKMHRPLMCSLIVCMLAQAASVFAANADTDTASARQVDSEESEIQYERSKSLLAEGRGQEALEWMVRAAEAGHVAAQLDLAQALLVDGKNAEAAIWIQRAADAGNVDARLAYGMLLLRGSGVTKDEREALRLFTLAAEQGSTQAQFMVAVAYHNGSGVARDDRRALDLFLELARQDNPDGQFNAAIMYLNGEGTSQSDAEAAAWLALAVQSYAPGAQRDAAAVQLADLRSRLGATGNREAEALYEQHVSALVSAGYAVMEAAPLAVPPDQNATALEVPADGDAWRGLSGYIQTGLRAQTNANSATSSYLNNPTAAPISDVNQMLLGRLDWSTGTPWKGVNSIDTNLTLYKTRQNTAVIPGLTYAELSTGPELQLKAQRWNSTLRPYLSASYIETDNTFYQRSGTLGLSLRLVIDRNTALVVAGETAAVHYHNSAAQPNNSDLSGRNKEASARLVRLLFPRVVGSLSASLRDYSARQAWQSYEGFTVVNGYTLKLPGLVKAAKDQQIDVYAGIGYERRHYETPIPGFSSSKRRDGEWQVTLSGTIPLMEQLSLSLTLQRTAHDSSLSIFEYGNSSLLLATTLRY